MLENSSESATFIENHRQLQMKDFIAFLKHPYEEFKMPPKKFWSVFWVFCLLFILSIATLLIPTPSLKVDGSDFPVWLAAILAPVVEELSFRLWMKRNTVNILISAIGFSWTLASIFLPDSIPTTERFVLRGLIALAGGGVSLMIKERIVNANFVVLFYASAIIFGFSHFSNYVGNIAGFQQALLVFIAQIPKVLSGLFDGYVRVGYGIHASILFHIAHNIPPCLLSYLLLMSS